jgi:hypothetical protein
MQTGEDGGYCHPHDLDDPFAYAYPQIVGKMNHLLVSNHHLNPHLNSGILN